MKIFFRIFPVLFTLIFFSCNNKSDYSETDNLFKFKDYISYNTYGKNSIGNSIRVELAKPLEQYESTQEIPSEYLKISPDTKGRLLIENGNILIFLPEKKLIPDTEYTVTVFLDKLYDDVERGFESYTFSFKTITANFKLNLGELQSTSKEWQYITGVLEVSDFITSEKARKLITVEQEENKNIHINWTSNNSEAKFFDFKIDSIHRKIEDSKIKVSWNGKAIKADNKGEEEITIPGQNNFTVVDVKSVISPQASLSINFSDPIKENQNFEGLVVIENTSNLLYEVDGNVLHVYPQNRIVGEVNVTIFNGIKNTSDYSLKKEFSELISFEQIKPGVRLLSKGVILPNSSSNPFYFEAVNLKSVDVRVIKIFQDNMLQFLQSSDFDDRNFYDLKRVGRRIVKKTIQLDQTNTNNGVWKAHALNLSKLFKADPGALYRIEISFKREYTSYDCSFASEENTSEENESFEDDYYYEDDSESDNLDEDEREERYWDNELYSWRKYRYNWEQQDNPCHDAYYSEDRFAKANIIGSDLGLIVKKSENNAYHFIASNLLTTNPESEVVIKLYNFQQQLVGSTTTDFKGFSLYDSDKKIAFAVAQKGNNYAYVKLDDGNALSLSNFDVSGKKLQKGLKGFIYTERGVYRPGDNIHLTFVLNDQANKLPKNHPVKLEVTDARGKLVQRTVKNESVDGFYYFPIATKTKAPTGNWRATISVGGVKFTKNLKVATIKPNRLKLKLNFNDEILNASKPIKGSASALWLHGAVARNLKIAMDVTLRSTTTAFKKYPNYIFNDPIRSFDKVEIPILGGENNSNFLSYDGKINFSKKLDIGDKAPGMLKATFLTKVFEGGGDFSIDVFSKNVAPYTHFVGLKAPETERYGSYDTDTDVQFNVATVDAQGNASGNRKLEVKVFKIEWRWWWNRGYDNLSRYENATVHRPVSQFEITTKSNGKASFNVNIPNEEGGRYLVRVIDKKSGHATGKVAYFYQDWWKTPTDGNSESAKMLVFSADKETYQVGEKAIITFPSASEGRALISVENGTEVLSNEWAVTKKGETKVSIPITEEMAPNVFVNISLLQPHEQTKNDLPIRLYGVIPLLVENPSTQLHPVLKMPDVLKPEENFTVEVSEENNKTMTYTIAVVDEGLLDLTRFETPKIHDAFYSKEALGVKTFDIYDLVIGAYSGSVDNIYAIGGGDEAAGAKNRKADRFKPVVTFLGPFHLRKGKTDKHEIKMPNYIGSVRTMVIAGENKNSAYGKTEKTTPVRKPLMVLASLPRKLSPGEKVTLPVTVFAMENKIKKATISVKTGKGLKAINGTSKTITFSEIGEKIVNFEFDVLATPFDSAQGTQKFQTIEVLVSGNGEKASYKVEIDVVNPNPISQKTTPYTLSENASKTINFETFGVAGTNGAMLEISTLPPMNFGKRMEYLIRYPHGCVEQTTSSVFPQLFLDDIFDITFDKKKEIEKNIKAAIVKLGDFQTTNGGLSYWQGESSADEWGTNYAGHFMLEAKKKGYALPISFLSNWLRYQQITARQWRNSNTQYNSSLTQAYRLYTLALAGKPELAAMNRLRESKHLSNDAKWRLAAAYALVGKKNFAQEITQTANINFAPRDYDYFTYGSAFRNKAMALETMVALGDSKQRDMAISVAKDLSSQHWYSTQETSYALLAMAKMVLKNGGKSMDVSFVQNKKTTNIKTDRAVAQRELSFVEGNNSIEITNKKENVVFVSLSQKGKLPLGKELTDSKNLSVKTNFKDASGKSLNISNLRQGTEITAQITVTNLSNNWVGNVALSQIFPSGWEIVNTSFTDLEGNADEKARYKDIRDDRVNFYFDISARKSKTFTVKLNASYLGNYYLPGAQTEAMYDNNYYARNKGQWISVKK